MVRRSNTVTRASIEAEADPDFFLARVSTIYGYDYAQLEPTSVRVTHCIDWKQKVRKFDPDRSSILMGQL